MKNSQTMKTNRAVYPANLVHIIVREVAAQDIAPARILKDSGIDEASLLQTTTRLSMQQIIQVCRNACTLAPDAMLAAHIGSRMHIGACGFYGYAMLSSPSHAKVVKLAPRYDRIISPFTSIWFNSIGSYAYWYFDLVVDIHVTDPLYIFLMEMKISSLRSWLSDLYGPSNYINRVRTKAPEPAHAAFFSTMMGCPVEYGSEANEARFDASAMQRPMAYSDPLSNTAMRELCDQVLMSIQEQGDITEAVQSILIGRPGVFPSADAMARILGLNGRRALLRKLDTEGTSYREILTKVRMRLAEHYLDATNLTIEEIAERLSYSDAASFRQAFQRWANSNPTEYRRRPNRSIQPAIALTAAEYRP